MKHFLFSSPKENSLEDHSILSSEQFKADKEYPNFDIKDYQVKLHNHLLHFEECFGKLPSHLLNDVVQHEKHRWHL
jgi:hypothetical protein